ncbi:BPM2 [Symbiodinium sp. CCMP2592]|nr:BPM2 [Symbiodinium sp. CCMP2592]
MAVTAEGLRAEIEATEQQVREAKTRGQALMSESREAEERQQLRLELAEQQKILAAQEAVNIAEIEWRKGIDADLLGRRPEKAPVRQLAPACKSENISFRKLVTEGEYIWRIDGFSWVRSGLRQSRQDRLESDQLLVGQEAFFFVYDPSGRTGSLALVCTGGRVAFRYKVYVKARSGAFVQWGKRGDVIHDDPSYRTYGPDVEGSDAAVGIFGLTHEELLESEWVQNDALTAKFALEVRPHGPPDIERQSLCQVLEVQENTLSCDMQALWESGRCCDVEFHVQEEVIHAHSQILCARATYFGSLFRSGLQESISRVIVIQDCSAVAFRTFLHFLYSDDMAKVQATLFEVSLHAADSPGGSSRVAMTQQLLAVSHKYGVTKLQLFCELQLCKELTVSGVCSILAQARLCEAKRLETACFFYIKDHVAEVVMLQDFKDLLRECNAVGVKLSLFLGGVPDEEADAVIE